MIEGKKVIVVMPAYNTGKTLRSDLRSFPMTASMTSSWLTTDYQYSPRLVTAMSSMVASGHYNVVSGSRIHGSNALKGGMPLYKYIANRLLTLIENLVLRVKLSEYHTGFRAFSRQVLESLPLEINSDDFIFDNEMLAQAVYFGFRIGEISCPTRYFPRRLVDKLRTKHSVWNRRARHNGKVRNTAARSRQYRPVQEK